MQYYPGYVFLWFRNSKPFVSLPLKRKICVDNDKLRCEWIRDYTEYFDPLPPAIDEMPPDSESPANILNTLNDDCLRIIFERDELSQIDLCAVAMVCKRFRRVAKAAFRTKYIRNTPTIYNDIDLKQSIWRIDECIRIFGNTIQSLNVSDFQAEDLIIDMANRFCGHIKHLRTCVTKLNLLDSLWLRLEKLSITMQTFLPHYPTVLPSIKCPKLYELSMDSVCMIENETMHEFFELNPQITTLAFRRCYIDFGVESILRHLPNITTLSIRSNPKFDIDFDCIGQLKHLQTFRATAKGKMMQSILEVIKANELPLKCLIVRCIDEDAEFMDFLCEMTMIKTLQIRSIDGDRLMQLVRCLHNMTKIVVQSMDIDLKDIRQMLEVAGNKLNDVHITIETDTIDRKEINPIVQMARERYIRLKITIVELEPIKVRG